MLKQVAKPLFKACATLLVLSVLNPLIANEPRDLEGYVKQEKTFLQYLKENHPIFKYEKAGRLIGEYKINTRQQEFMDISGGPAYAETHGLDNTAVTYRLGVESILDYPNNFVGPKKCGECHPAQYAAWERSRHAKVVRFPDELEEVGGDPKKPLYGTKSTILPLGIEADDVYAVIGTPRTKYGFIDRWLVRGTYHIEGGKLSDLSGNLVAGGNQFSRFWAKYLTPELAKKINSFVPGFPVKMEEFGTSASSVWGTNSYGSSYRKMMLFQPASSYCETCHSFKFDFKSKEEFFAALGNVKELRKHTISKGISCEECHGAGAHLYGARGAGMPSNCERCHQRFVYDGASTNPRKPFNAYFKSRCPSCGTEGSQMYNTVHYDKGMRCSTCHDPHEVTFNDWKSGVTKTGLKKECKDCHEPQEDFFKKEGIHAKIDCTSCHMPNVGSCENFAAIQFPDHAGFDNVRASHIWKIDISPDKKMLNPPGKGRDVSIKKGWKIDRNKAGNFYLDLMWACARTSTSDINVVGPNGSGCHSVIQSTLPKKLHYKDQASVYAAVVEWQKPVKEGYDKIIEGIKSINSSLARQPNMKEKAHVISLTHQAQVIAEKLAKDASWGVHGPAYSKQLVFKALAWIDEAKRIIKDQ